MLAERKQQCSVWVVLLYVGSQGQFLKSDIGEGPKQVEEPCRDLGIDYCRQREDQC